MGENGAGNGDWATPAAAAAETGRAEAAAAISGNDCGILAAVDDDEVDEEM